MICGSSTAPFYYGFMCDENRFYGRFYLAMVYFFCLVAAVLTVVTRDHKHKKWIKAISFIVAGWSCAPGAIHLLVSDQRLVNSFIYWPWCHGGLLYTFGGILYALKFPERFIPKKFDIWLSSHSIFHWMVLAAAILHFWASLRTFHMRQLFPCPETGKIPTNDNHFSFIDGVTPFSSDG